MTDGRVARTDRKAHNSKVAGFLGTCSRGHHRRRSHVVQPDPAERARTPKRPVVPTPLAAGQQDSALAPPARSWPLPTGVAPGPARACRAASKTCSTCRVVPDHRGLLDCRLYLHRLDHPQHGPEEHPPVVQSANPLSTSRRERFAISASRVPGGPVPGGPGPGQWLRILGTVSVWLS